MDTPKTDINKNKCTYKTNTGSNYSMKALFKTKQKMSLVTVCRIFEKYFKR